MDKKMRKLEEAYKEAMSYWRHFHETPNFREIAEEYGVNKLELMEMFDNNGGSN